MASDGETVLSYHNCLLRRSDQALLEGPRWLNDQLIAFAFEYFECDQFKEHENDVAFISPDIAQFIKFSTDAEIGMFLEPLTLCSRQLVFLAINDNNSVSSVGGSHWSLLVYSRKNHAFSHYDSSGPYNEDTARRIAKKMQPHVGPGQKTTFIQEHAPQQHNGYDCGLFVICNTEHLCRQELLGSTTSLQDAVTQARVSKKREELSELILRLAAK